MADDKIVLSLELEVDDSNLSKVAQQIKDSLGGVTVGGMVAAGGAGLGTGVHHGGGSWSGGPSGGPSGGAGGTSTIGSTSRPTGNPSQTVADNIARLTNMLTPGETNPALNQAIKAANATARLNKANDALTIGADERLTNTTATDNAIRLDEAKKKTDILASAAKTQDKINLSQARTAAYGKKTDIKNEFEHNEHLRRLAFFQTEAEHEVNVLAMRNAGKVDLLNTKFDRATQLADHVHELSMRTQATNRRMAAIHGAFSGNVRGAISGTIQSAGMMLMGGEAAAGMLPELAMAGAAIPIAAGAAAAGFAGYNYFSPLVKAWAGELRAAGTIAYAGTIGLSNDQAMVASHIVRRTQLQKTGETLRDVLGSPLMTAAQNSLAGQGERVNRLGQLVSNTHFSNTFSYSALPAAEPSSVAGLKKYFDSHPAQLHKYEMQAMQNFSATQAEHFFGGPKMPSYLDKPGRIAELARRGALDMDVERHANRFKNNMFAERVAIDSLDGMLGIKPPSKSDHIGYYGQVGFGMPEGYVHSYARQKHAEDDWFKHLQRELHASITQRMKKLEGFVTGMDKSINQMEGVLQPFFSL